jgi:hypothetical protein
MKGYFVANGQAMTNSLDGESMMAPLTNWLKCEALVFTSFPSEILDPACEVFDRVEQFKSLLDEVKKIDPVSAELNRIVEDMREQVVEEAKNESLRFASSLTGIAIDEFFRAVSEDVSSDRLNQQFSKSPEDVPLLLIPRIAEHVDLDMNLDAAGTFSSREFPPIANAITLTKLSLMSPAQLNSLIGERRYSSSSKGYGNVMYRFASSIDGNHQWLPTPPPYPRADADHKIPEDEQTPVDESYGYSSDFPLWHDLRIRQGTFRSIFKGPLNGGFSGGTRPVPAIEITDYNYNPTRECTFPAYDAEAGDDGCRTRRSWFQKLLEALGLR